jgi:MFS family permease
VSPFRQYATHVRAFSPNARLFLGVTVLWALGQALLGVTRNLYLKEIGFNEAEIGGLLSAVQVGTVVTTVPAALLLDRWRMKPLVLIAMVVTIAGNAAQALLPGHVALLSASFVVGAGSSVFGVAVTPFFAKYSASAERGHLFGVNIGLGAVASTLGTLAVGPMQAAFGSAAPGLRTMMLGGAAAGFLAVIPLLPIREPLVPAARRSLRDFFLARDWRTLARLCIPDATIGLGAGLTIPFINLYFQGRFHLSPAQISFWFAASHAMNAAGFFLAPALAQKFGRPSTIVATQFLSIPFFAALAFTASLPLAVASFLVRSLLMNMSQPLQSAFTMDKAAPGEQAVTNSIRQLSWNLSWVVSASAGGWMIHHVTVGRDGYTLPMLVTIGLYLVGSSLFLLFWGRATTSAAVSPSATLPPP